MALVALLADKGAPGVTTSAVVLAAVWPQPAVLAECDAAGGDLLYRLPGSGGAPLAQDRGVLSLASAVRSPSGPEVIWEHTQQLDGGLPVLVGPTLPEQAAAMAGSWTPISGMLAGLPGTDVIADCGRVLGETPVLPVLRRAELIVLVARHTVEGVAHLRHGLVAVARAVNAHGSSAGTSALRRTVVLLIADGRRGREATRELALLLANSPGLGDVSVLGALADDPVGARGLSGQWGRRLDRSALVASARPVAQAAHARAHANDPQPAETDPAAGALAAAPAAAASAQPAAPAPASGRHR